MSSATSAASGLRTKIPMIVTFSSMSWIVALAPFSGQTSVLFPQTPANRPFIPTITILSLLRAAWLANNYARAMDDETTEIIKTSAAEKASRCQHPTGRQTMNAGIFPLLLASP